MPTQLNNSTLINNVQNILLPCAAQWSESVRMAAELLSVQEAQPTEALIRAALTEAGIDSTGNLFAVDAGCMINGRLITVGEMMAIVITARVVNAFSETPNALFASQFDNSNPPVAVNPPKPKSFILRSVQSIGK